MERVSAAAAMRYFTELYYVGLNHCQGEGVEVVLTCKHEGLHHMVSGGWMIHFIARPQTPPALFLPPYLDVEHVITKPEKKNIPTSYWLSPACPTTIILFHPHILAWETQSVLCSKININLLLKHTGNDHIISKNSRCISKGNYIWHVL